MSLELEEEEEEEDSDRQRSVRYETIPKSTESHLIPPQQSPPTHLLPPTLLTTTTPRHKYPIAILTPTNPRLRILDTSRPFALHRPIPRLPEERPATRLILHLTHSRRLAGICRARPVWSTVAGVVLVVGDEDGKGLWALSKVREEGEG